MLGEIEDCKNNHYRHYSEYYDTYWCCKCDKWLEPVCGDDDCTFCIDRPGKPSNSKEKCGDVIPFLLEKVTLL